MYVSKDFTGNLIPFNKIISYNEGVESEHYPSITGNAVFIPKEEEPVFITILSYSYITNSLMNVIDSDKNTFSIHCNDYDKVFLIF